MGPQVAYVELPGFINVWTITVLDTVSCFTFQRRYNPDNVFKIRRKEHFNNIFNQLGTTTRHDSSLEGRCLEVRQSAQYEFFLAFLHLKHFYQSDYADDIVLV
jgi:hypothetical protein